ncbi:MAG: hypothetical protein CMP11_04675 [Zetaproteobacteria bacterium]|nr:hypothetical protein [Pseudobdellovibrionaceae bacterium]|tara:strand:+ start:1326 stop:1640 length:315 start_codon:yes stop_codon:yes gene_type:complete
MKNKVQKISLFVSSLYTGLAFGADGVEGFKIDAPGEIIDHNNYIAHGMSTAEYLIKGGAGLFSLVCFIQAASFARQGRYANCVGSMVGGVISACAVFLTGKFSQ